MSVFQIYIVPFLTFIVGFLIGGLVIWKKYRWMKFLYLDLELNARLKLEQAYEVCIQSIDDLSQRITVESMSLKDDDRAEYMGDDLRYWQKFWTTLLERHKKLMVQNKIVLEHNDQFYPMSFR